MISQSLFAKKKKKDKKKVSVSGPGKQFMYIVKKYKPNCSS